jgi:polyisoprenoid-binding protein YceI
VTRRRPAGTRSVAAVLAAVLAASGPAAAARADFVLDPEHSFVTFEVLHFDTSTIRGRFGPLAGSVSLDPALGIGEVDVRIETAAVASGIPVFDARLRAADLLACTAYPEAYFVARRVRFDREGRPAEVRGEFTLRGVSQPLTLRMERYRCRDDRGRSICGGDFEGELRRSDFGMSFGLPFVADRVRLLVQVEAFRRPASP